MQRKLFTAFLFLFTTGFLFVSAQQDLPTDYLSASFHQSRREAARSLMPENSVMVVFAAAEKTFANDVTYLYHQNPDLYYFTGYKEPNSVLFLFKESQKAADGSSYSELFFVQKKDPRSEQWNGRRLGVEGVKEKLGIQTVFTSDEFKNFAINLSSFAKIITDNFPDDVKRSRADGHLYNLIQQVKTKGAIVDEKDAKLDMRSFRQITSQLREVKTERL